MAFEPFNGGMSLGNSVLFGSLGLFYFISHQSCFPIMHQTECQLLASTELISIVLKDVCNCCLFFFFESVR